MARMTARPATSPETPRGGGGLWSPLSSPSHLRPSNQATPRSMRREELSMIDPSAVGSEDAGDDDADTAAEMLALSKSRVEKILGGLGVDANVEVSPTSTRGSIPPRPPPSVSSQWEKLEADADEAARAAETATDDVAGLLRARDEAAATKLGAFGAELAKYEEGRAARDAARAKQQNVVRMMKAGAAAKKGDSAAVQMELTVGLLRAQLLKRGGAEARKPEIAKAMPTRGGRSSALRQLALNAAAAAMVEEAEAARAAAPRLRRRRRR